MSKFATFILLAALGGCASKGGVDREVLLNPSHPQMNQQAPEQFKARFETSAGDFVIEVRRALAPRGADRFYNLVKNGFYDDQRFFRVVPGFVVQFGIPADPEIAAVWSEANIPDDPVQISNMRGTLCFAAKSTPNSRSTQLFINFKDNGHLDGMGFAPFGRVVEGMESVDSIYSGYTDKPDQLQIQMKGNDYLEDKFPKLDYIKTARIAQ